MNDVPFSRVRPAPKEFADPRTDWVLEESARVPAERRMAWWGMDGQGVAKAAVFLLIVMLGAVLVWWRIPSHEAALVPENFFDQPQSLENLNAPLVDHSPEQEPELVFIHVAGEVHSPGLIRLPEGARVADAVEAAGGAKEEANLSAINLAAQVRDGEQVFVPQHGQNIPQAAPPQSGGVVYINTATAAELQTLPGIGPVMAERIISYRQEHGPFAKVEDLQAVSGIGPVLMAELLAEVAL